MARILVIEDNPDNLELMSYLLEAYGHSVSIAEDGERGIEAARREKPDLVACDIHLPGVDGYRVVAALKSDPGLKGTPVVALTALAMVGDRDRILAAGFDGCITKPVNPETVVGEIDAFLRADLRGSPPRPNGVRSAPSAAAPRTAHAVIVVVDDAPTNRELIYQTLAPSGYDVRLAENVPDALRLMSGIVPDLILSDLHMPGDDGFELVRRIKADPRLAAVPFLFISSSVWGAKDRDTALALGVSRFLLRPIDPQKLLDEVARHLQNGGIDGDDPRR